MFPKPTHIQKIMKEAEARFSSENRRVFPTGKIEYNHVMFPKPTHIQKIMKEAEARFSSENRRVFPTGKIEYNLC